MTAVWVALIVAVSAMAGPLLLAGRMDRLRRRERMEDYARQDAVAARTAAVTNGKLDVIHGLVNSNLTAALSAELDAKEALLVLLRRVRVLEPSHEIDATLDATEAKIAELRATLDDRLAQTRIADDQIAHAAALNDDAPDRP